MVQQFPAQQKTYEGGCLCGNIRFTARAPVHKQHSCSCRMCQRHTGALTTCWVEFPRDQIDWTGPGGVPSTWRSSAKSSRAFCGRCGSTLGAIDDKPVVALVLGAFDSKSKKEFAPRRHYNVSTRPKWWTVMTAERLDIPGS